MEIRLFDITETTTAFYITDSGIEKMVSISWMFAEGIVTGVGINHSGRGCVTLITQTPAQLWDGYRFSV